MLGCQAVDGFGQAWSGFVGIDWSGAKGQFIAGIQLAMARPGTSVPETILPPQNEHWSRQDVLKFLLDQAHRHRPGSILVGIDFAAHPFVDCGIFFPIATMPLKTPSRYGGLLIWSMGLRIFMAVGCSGIRYGGILFGAPRFSAPRYESRRRVTELVAKASGRSPSPAFKAVGAIMSAPGQWPACGLFIICESS